MSTVSAQASGTPTSPRNAMRERPRQLWQVPVFLTGLLAIVFVAWAPSLRQENPAQKYERDLDTLRRSLQQRQVAIDELVTLADDVAQRSEQFPQRAGVAQLLAGTVYLRKAERGGAERAAELRQKALFHLEWAEKLGVNVADQPQLWYRLGKLHFQSGSESKRALDYLMRSAGAEEPVACYGMLVEANLRLPTPNLEAALAANLKQIEHSEDESILGPARLLRGELLLKTNQRAEALKVLGRINSPRPLRLKARALEARAAMEDGLWARAVPLWQELLAEPSVVPGGKGRILYSLGLCYYQLDPKDVSAENTWHAASKCGGEEGQAAALKLAELQLQSPNPANALEHFKQAFEKVATPRDFTNSLMDTTKVLDLFELAFRLLGERQDTERVGQLAELHKKLAPPGTAEVRLAQTAEAQARAFRAQADKERGPEVALLEEKARKQFVIAGNAFVKSVEGIKPPEQLDRLWRGIDCYLQAPDYAKAVVVLEQFVKLGASAEQQSKAWYHLAMGCQALKQLDKAKQAFHSCIQTNGSFEPRARLQLAQIEIDAKNFLQAELILVQNLRQTESLPDRSIHAESLLKLADLLFGQQKFEEAHVRYKVAVQQYPNHPTILQVRDQLATCYLRVAERFKKDLDNNLTGPKEKLWPAPKIAKMRMDRNVWLTDAQKSFQDLADDLNNAATATQLAPHYEKLLRKVSLLSVDCLLELPKTVPEATRRYKDLSHRFRQHLEGLVAAARLCECYRQASQDGDGQAAALALQEARAAVAAALDNLLANDPPRIPEAVFEGPPGTWTRAAWVDWFNDAGRRLKRNTTGL